MKRRYAQYFADNLKSPADSRGAGKLAVREEVMAEGLAHGMAYGMNRVIGKQQTEPHKYPLGGGHDGQKSPKIRTRMGFSQVPAAGSHLLSRSSCACLTRRSPPCLLTAAAPAGGLSSRLGGKPREAP